MPTPVLIPKATISMEEAIIVRWLKSEGEDIAQDEVLFEMETDKALLEVPAPVGGTLARILVAEGTVPVESVVGWIREPGETVENESLDSPGEPSVHNTPELPGLTENGMPTPNPTPGRLMATPAARRRATEIGIDLSTIKGTGPGGRITEQDVEQASPAVKIEQPAQKEPGSRRTIAQHVTAAWQTVPHIHIAREIDGSAIADVRGNRPQYSVTDLLLFAVSRVLPRYDLLASTLDIAFAVSTSRGVVAPVIRNAGQLDVDGISQRRRELALAVREQWIKVDDLQGGSFTLTNLGMEGVDFFVPIINAPQAAILAIGAMRRKPVVVGDSITIGWRMWANLAIDHRVADGAYAAQFLMDLERYLVTLPNECIGRKQ